jgi:hypothetical protein
MITDARVAVACSQFTKGSWWFGMGLIGLPVAVLLTVISKSMAAQRRHGKMLVGHVRYEWLQFVDTADRGSRFGKNFIGLHFRNPNGAEWMALSMVLNTMHPAPVIGKDIATRAARFKAAHHADAAEREALLRYAEQPTHQEHENGMCRYALPA